MTDGTSLVEKADQIRQTDDYWVSFERLQEALGQTTYRDAIKAALKAVTTHLYLSHIHSYGDSRSEAC